MHLYRVIGILTRTQTHGWLLQSFPILISRKPGILRAQPLSSWFGCWGSRSRRGCPQLFQVGRRLSWRTASKGATSPEISKLWQIINTDHFQRFEMAALVKKAPALLAAAKELATPKLNTFLRYAKVNVLLEIQRSMFWWKFKNIENLLNRLSWSLQLLQRSLQPLQIYQPRWEFCWKEFMVLYLDKCQISQWLSVCRETVEQKN